MKRRLLPLALLVLAGVIVNVAVAWGCAWWCRPQGPPFFRAPTFTEKNRWDSEKPAEFTQSVGLLTAHGSFGVDLLDLQGDLGGRVAPVEGGSQVRIDNFTMDDFQEYIREHRAGWPARCLFGREWFRWSVAVTPPTVHKESLWEWQRQTTGDQRLLPVEPIWPGFAINTIFYAAILWMLFAAPLALRRRRRVKRGLCPRCAYPVGASEVCTECGAAVTSKAVPK